MVGDKMEYRGIDITKSRTNINNLLKNMNECKSFLDSSYLTNINKNIWNAKSKITFANNLRLLNNETTNLITRLNKSLLAIDNIQKIQSNNNMIKILEDENKILQNSLIPNDKLKVLQNIQKIENLRTEVGFIESQIINEWSM